MLMQQVDLGKNVGIAKEEKKRDFTITKQDFFNIVVIMLLYGILSFINLGSTTNPQTFWYAQDNSTDAVIDLGNTVDVSYMRVYTGARFGNYKISASYDGVNYAQIAEYQQNSVFFWNDIPINTNCRYICITPDENSPGVIGEVLFVDNNNNIIEAIPNSDTARLITDERKTVPEKISYKNCTYFDEIYHARTAYEFVHGLDVYEWTHPHLGKLIMSIPIRLGGMTPFNYRLLGNIAGILMLLVIYIFAKRMCGRTRYATLAAVLFAADGMHFVQTRIATVDSYLVLFIMLSFLFMYQYMCCDPEKDYKKMHWNLLFSGIFFGCASATKWNGIYSSIALAIVFFIHFFSKQSKQKLNDTWKSKRMGIFWACFLYFIFIPFAIYYTAYLPHMQIHPSDSGLKGLWDLQLRMFNYHKGVEGSGHPFASMWYQWPIGMKPLWYYDGQVPQGTVSSIVLHSNPILWWTGDIAMLYVLVKGIVKKNKNQFLLIFAILALYLPNTGIGREMFLYHYFPVIPFMILCIVQLIEDLEDRFDTKNISVVYAAIILLVFGFFYPVYSGLEIPLKYAQKMLWFKGWTLFRNW